MGNREREKEGRVRRGRKGQKRGEGEKGNEKGTGRGLGKGKQETSGRDTYLEG